MIYIYIYIYIHHKNLLLPDPVQRSVPKNQGRLDRHPATTTVVFACKISAMAGPSSTSLDFFERYHLEIIAGWWFIYG